MNTREPLIIDAVPERISRKEANARTQGASPHANQASAAASKRPTWKRALIGVLALLYILSPLDLVPDWIPLVGWLDDIGILAWAARQVFFKK
ncbi:MAG: YkvA family protein [Casimicrobium sp.]